MPGEAEVCDLCGTPLVDVSADPGVEHERDRAGVPNEANLPAEASAESDGVFCNQCGWKNPPGARFCSQCGAELQRGAATASPARPASAPPAAAASAGAGAAEPPAEAQDQGAIGRQIGILVGAGLLLVVALFLINVVSKDAASGPAGATGEEATAGMAAGPSAEEILSQVEAPDVPQQVAERAAELRAEIERLDDVAGGQRRRELIDLYLGAGLLGRAAVEQRQAAEQQGSFDAWRRAGDRLYDWMETVEGAPRVDVANLTVEAYEQALSINPDDADVRTDLATAYLNTSSPMLGVEQITRVLDQEPDHVQANFNYGYMLMVIGRLDQAKEQFERVQDLVEPGTQFDQRAEELLQVIREEQAGTGG